jgi:hypothetical protein
MPKYHAFSAAMGDGKWEDLAPFVLTFAMGLFLVADGAMSMIMLPESSMPSERYQMDLANGTDGKAYTRNKVIVFARIMMVSLGVVLLLASLLPFGVRIWRSGITK